jgi:histidinol dehydrogenase
MAADQVTVSDEPKVVGVTAEAAVKAIKAGRNKDVDIAAQIISDHADQMAGETWSVEEEQKLIRRIDWRLIPTVRIPVMRISTSLSTNLAQLFVCATLSGLDKTAISAAAIYHIKSDLNLTGDQYSWLGSAPFFGGLAFMGPLAYCLQK